MWEPKRYVRPANTGRRASAEYSSCRWSTMLSNPSTDLPGAVVRNATGPTPVRLQVQFLSAHKPAKALRSRTQTSQAPRATRPSRKRRSAQTSLATSIRRLLARMMRLATRPIRRSRESGGRLLRQTSPIHLDLQAHECDPRARGPLAIHASTDSPAGPRWLGRQPRTPRPVARAPTIYGAVRHECVIIPLPSRSSRGIAQRCSALQARRLEARQATSERS